MAAFEEKPSILTVIILGGCLPMGVVVAGCFIGSGAAWFKSDTQTVAVKGLVEKEVKADETVWTLTLRRASNDLKDVHMQIGADREMVMAFLKKQGFRDAEITRQRTRTIDRLGREYTLQQTNERFRYVVTTSLVVRTSNIDLVQAALGSEELLESGVVLDEEREGPFANPRHGVSKFNDLRTQLSAEPSKNARTLLLLILVLASVRSARPSN